jgi:agmatinase
MGDTTCHPLGVRQEHVGDEQAMSYRPIDARVLPRFAGIRTFARLPHVEAAVLSDVDVAVLGFPFDTATSFRSGARFGPEAIRSASVLLRPYHAVHGVDIFERLGCVDGGDVPVAPGDTVETYVRAQAELARVADTGVFPLVLGGDHSITLAELRVLAARHGPLALIHLDAHGDTWDQYFGQPYFHGTTFRRALEEGLIDAAASVQAGLRGPLYGDGDLAEAREMGFTVLTSDELRSLGPLGYGELVRERVGSRGAFLSFDVDFCDPAYAPGTGTPEVGGFSSAEAQAFLRALAGVELVGADVVEVSPPYDGAGQPTALLGANVAWEILALVAVQPRENGGTGR